MLTLGNCLTPTLLGGKNSLWLWTVTSLFLMVASALIALALMRRPEREGRAG